MSSSIEEILQNFLTTFAHTLSTTIVTTLNATLNEKFEEFTNKTVEDKLKPPLSAVGPSTDTASSNSAVNVTLDERRRSYTGEFKSRRVTELDELLREGKLQQPEALAHLPDSLRQYPILVQYAFSEGRNGTFETTAPSYNYYHELKYILDGIVSKKERTLKGEKASSTNPIRKQLLHWVQYFDTCLFDRRYISSILILLLFNSFIPLENHF